MPKLRPFVERLVEKGTDLRFSYEPSQRLPPLLGASCLGQSPVSLDVLATLECVQRREYEQRFFPPVPGLQSEVGAMIFFHHPGIVTLSHCYATQDTAIQCITFNKESISHLLPEILATLEISPRAFLPREVAFYRTCFKRAYEKYADLCDLLGADAPHSLGEGWYRDLLQCYTSLSVRDVNSEVVKRFSTP